MDNVSVVFFQVRTKNFAELLRLLFCDFWVERVPLSKLKLFGKAIFDKIPATFKYLSIIEVKHRPNNSWNQSECGLFFNFACNYASNQASKKEKLCEI